MVCNGCENREALLSCSWVSVLECLLSRGLASLFVAQPAECDGSGRQLRPRTINSGSTGSWHSASVLNVAAIQNHDADQTLSRYEPQHFAAPSLRSMTTRRAREKAGRTRLAALGRPGTSAQQGLRGQRLGDRAEFLSFPRRQGRRRFSTRSRCRYCMWRPGGQSEQCHLSTSSSRAAATSPCEAHAEAGARSSACRNDSAVTTGR